MMEVYILEQFITREDLQNNVNGTRECLEKYRAMESPDPAMVKSIEEFHTSNINRLANNPDGFWQGASGKIRIIDFLIEAKKEVKRYGSTQKYRVVTAEIPKGSQHWVGYKNARINETLTVYLNDYHKEVCVNE